MKKSNFSETQILKIVAEAESGRKIGDICREYGISQQTFYNWHKETILNFFDNRATNASAESFNVLIKLFRANQKGVRDTTFFLFRLSKLYA
jgi:transposase-like protein